MYKKHLKECQPLNNKPKLRFKDKNGNAYPEWEENLLGDIGELRNGIAKGSEFFGHGHKFINLQDVFGKDCLYNDDYDLVETSEKERQLNDLKKVMLFLYVLLLSPLVSDCLQ